MSQGLTIRIFPTADGVMEHAARTLVETARACVSRRVAVALSGGSTPARLYERIAEAHRDEVPWGRLEVFFGDERAVGPEDPESNYRLAADKLLSRVPIRPGMVHRMPADDPDPDGAARRHEEEIRRVVSAGADVVPAFDLIWLGLGTDGHTASLFPGSPALAEETRLVIPTDGPRHRRMTFTLPLLRAAAKVQFLAVGAEKADAVRRVLEPREGEGPPLPAGRVAGSRGQVEWLLDRAAASLVQDPRLIA